MQSAATAETNANLSQMNIDPFSPHKSTQQHQALPKKTPNKNAPANDSQYMEVDDYLELNGEHDNLIGSGAAGATSDEASINNVDDLNFEENQDFKKFTSIFSNDTGKIINIKLDNFVVSNLK